MPMTREQWKHFEEQLSQPYGRLNLLVDGRLLELHVRHLDRKLVIAWYVDGNFLGKWLTEDCEERRRFARHSTRHLFSAKVRKGVHKSFQKKYGLDGTYTGYHWFWLSPAALRRHLVKHNASIELAEITHAYL